MIKILYFSFN